MRGRFFTEGDDGTKPGVAVINESAGQKFFPSEDPLGQKIADDEGGRDTVWQIVGVVSDVHEGAAGCNSRADGIFSALNQTGDSSFTLVVRTRQDATALLPELRCDAAPDRPKPGRIPTKERCSPKIEGTQERRSSIASQRG